MKLPILIRVLVLATGLAGVCATPSWSLPAPAFFDGGGYGPTAEGAVASALDDAVVTASGFGLFQCALVEAEVFPSSNPRRPFNAQVRVFCRP